jgi:hypothetical protein
MKIRHAVALALAGCCLILRTGDAASAPPSSAAPGDQISVLGCLSKSDESYGLSTVESFPQYVREIHSSGGAPSVFYKLAGHTSKLDNVGSFVRIYGTRTLINNGMNFPAGTIEIETVIEVSVPDATLTPSISQTSNWRKYNDSANGVAYSLPNAFPRAEMEFREPNFVGHANETALAGFEIPNDVWGASNFAGGSFAIYVTPEITKPRDCYKFGQSDPDDEVSSESINGVRYARLTQSSIPPEEIRYYHAFENGRCYEIAVDFDFYRTGDFDLGCEFSSMDPDTLTKLLLPRISFFKP